MSKILISICIPTYNGAHALPMTLDAIIRNIAKLEDAQAVEIVLTDDNSTDDTWGIIERYANAHSFIRAFKNEENLGMDGNFRQTALNAQGEYIWYSGQDDIFLEDAVRYVLDSLDSHPDVSIVNINFKQYSESAGRIVCESMFHLQAHHPEKLDLSKDLTFNNGAEYFNFFNDTPSFLPATIMRRDFWLTTKMDAYLGTHFIQYATILLNINNHKILAITRPLIRGLIPAEGWQTNGNKLFTIQLGAMKARKLVFDDPRNPFPAEVFNYKKSYYLRHFLRTAAAARFYGFKPSIENKNDLKLIYGTPLFYCYFLPIMTLTAIAPHRLLGWAFAIKKTIKSKQHA